MLFRESETIELKEVVVDEIKKGTERSCCGRNQKRDHCFC